MSRDGNAYVEKLASQLWRHDDIRQEDRELVCECGERMPLEQNPFFALDKHRVRVILAAIAISDAISKEQDA